MEFVFNETLLNITQAFPLSESSRYVTIESCQAYVKGVQGWNTIYQVCLAGLLMMYFFMLYKQGRFKREIAFVKRILKGDD